MRQFYLPKSVCRDTEALRLALRDHPGALESIIPHLTGDHSMNQIWAKLLSEGLSPECILAGLQFLDDHDLIEEGSSEMELLSDVAQDRFSSQMKLLARSFPSPFARDLLPEGLDGMRLQIALKKSNIVVTDSGDVATTLLQAMARTGFGQVVLSSYENGGRNRNHSTDMAALITSNSSMNFRTVNWQSDLNEYCTEEKVDLIIHCPDEFIAEHCEEVNRKCLELRVPMLPYRRVGLDIEIGPLIIPFETACYMCYVKRRDAALSPWERQHASESRQTGAFNMPLGVDFLLIEAMKVTLQRSEPVSRGRLLRLSFLSGITELHPVLKLPRCPACGIHRLGPTRKLWEE